MSVSASVMRDLEVVLAFLLEESGRSVDPPATFDERLQLLRALSNVRPPAPVPDDVLSAQDRVLAARREQTGVTAAEDLATRGDLPIALWRGDITTLDIDAIVNAANSRMLGCFVPLHGCIDNAIHTAAGIQLRLECDAIMRERGRDEPTGTATVTGAYNLPSRYVIHTVGPIVGGELTARHEADLASCYRSCLDAAGAHEGIRSLTLCCISTGEFRFPQDRAAEIAVAEVSAWLRENPGALDLVVFDVFGGDDYELYDRLLG